MIEAMAQATTVLYKYKNTVTPLAKYELLLGTIKSKIFGSAHPGDQMILEVKPVKFIAMGGIAKGVCTIGSKTISTAEMTFMAKNFSES